MPHCPKCGKENLEDAEFCMFCGTQIWRKTLGKEKKINNGLVVSCTLLFIASTYLLILAMRELLFIEYQYLKYEELFIIASIISLLAFGIGIVSGIWNLKAKNYHFALFGIAFVYIGGIIALITLLLETMESTTDIKEILNSIASWWFPLILSIISLGFVIKEKERFLK